MADIATGVTPETVKGYGYRRSPPDLNDHRYSYEPPAALKRALPARVDLRDRFVPRDQGALGSCTGFAICQLFDYQWRRQGLPPDRLSSPLFLYERERFIENAVASDSGAFPRDGFEALRKEGVCPEALWPYDPRRFAVEPPRPVMDEAARYRIDSYHAIDQRLTDMQACLAEEQAFEFGIEVYASLDQASVTRTGDVPMPHPGEPRVGGHSILCVGYDDAWRRFFFLNHWWNRAEGKWWGNQGFGTIPYDYMLNRELTGDVYTLGRILTV